MSALRAVGAFTGALAASWWFAAPAQAEPVDYLDKVPVQASPTCGGTVSGEAQVSPVQREGHVEDGVRVVIRYDAGIYDGSCSLTVTADWANLDTGASGSGDITSVSTIDGHYGFIGYAETRFVTGPGTVVITLSSHPEAEMRVTT